MVNHDKVLFVKVHHHPIQKKRKTLNNRIKTKNTYVIVCACLSNRSESNRFKY